MVLVVCRLCHPSSRNSSQTIFMNAWPWRICSACLPKKITDDQLYSALDKLLPHKAALEKHLKDKLGTLFDLKYDLFALR